MKRQDFVVLVPVKPLARAKTRLRVPAGRRGELAAAFAHDTIEAARRTDLVVDVAVVTSDAGFAEVVRRLGCTTIPDEGDLNGSLAAAADRLRSRFPDALPVALCSDLPALTPADLGRALGGMRGEGPWIVADADDLGTTLYAATYDSFAPRFGDRSRESHAAVGAIEILGELASLRCDVDDEASLAEAVRLGVGPATARALAASRPHTP